jgi:hypothetical protein
MPALRPVAIMGVVARGADVVENEGPRGERCPVYDRSPAVLVGIRHPEMRRWTMDLLASEHGGWVVSEPRSDELLVEAIDRTRPDLVVVDTVDFPACCRAALDTFPPGRVIVIGPEPDLAYRHLALSQGAGGWVCREHVAEEVSTALRAALGCGHRPCRPVSGGPSEEPGALPAGVRR